MPDDLIFLKDLGGEQVLQEPREAKDRFSCCCLPEVTCLTAAYDVPPEQHRVFSGCKPSDPCAEQHSRALGDSKMPQPQGTWPAFPEGMWNGDPVFPFC